VYAHRVTRTGDRTGDDHFVVHLEFLGSIVWSKAGWQPTGSIRWIRRADEHHSDGWRRIDQSRSPSPAPMRLTGFITGNMMGALVQSAVVRCAPIVMEAEG
jgi:hypothetical protein